MPGPTRSFAWILSIILLVACPAAGGLPISVVVDAVTRLSGRYENADDPSDADAKASAFLALAA